MDPPAVSEGEGGEGGGGVRGGKRGFRILIRCCISIFFSLSASFLFAFVFGLVALLIENFSASSPVSVRSACKIISSSVDLRSSKVCELGLLNYKAEHVFYPSEKRRFRCHDDYYWASVFEVEYKEYFSGQIFHAVAEAPKQALPHDCRPSFSTAWLTKMKYKVNETYSCRYILGSQKADLYSDDLFNCHLKEPSTAEMIRRIFILFTRSCSEIGSSGRQMLYTVIGIVSGMLVSMCVVIVIKSVQVLALAMAKKWDANKHQIRVSAFRCRRACLFVAYFFALGWLTLQYGKMIGFKQLSFNSIIGERLI
ncbi:uncharacterized protein LOC103714512 isoform X2 [Phoenix dactylifera]|uniref:Uncharacterized protein LOC103714512 isoform X2 n=1 Tax=Phoenix dactylifera TaxID=42345 RepID=A0A8B7CIJ1_PHODC|nr:uncharacterized protein LOC103714512 isoform X2 [Phoenix dactylifera]